MAVTIAGNTPLNNMLHKFDAANARAAKTAAMRLVFENKWNKLNTIRTFSSLISLLFVLFACINNRLTTIAILSELATLKSFLKSKKTMEIYYSYSVGFN